MKLLFSAFPAGFAGVALLLLRASLALFLASSLPMAFLPDAWCSIVLGALAAAVMAGFRARTGAVLSIAVIAFQLKDASVPARLAIATHALDAIALAMIGPGAFSIDARLFGRSTISLPR